MKKKTRKQTAKLAALCMAGVLAFSVSATSLSASAADLTANGKYYSNFGSYAELLKATGEINLKTAEEGQVLLKNDGTLPLSGRERVSVFGMASSKTVAGTSNSAFVKTTGFTVSERGPIYDSLLSAGFKVNPTLAEFYAAKGFSQNSCGKETISFNKESMNSLNLYNDVGVIVLARYGGEGADLDMVTSEEQDNMYGAQESKYENDALYKGTYAASSSSGGGGMGGPGMGGSTHNVAETSANYDAENGKTYKHYLQLTDSEEELIDFVAGKCKKVIVVLNTSNAMECYNLREDERVNGILLMGRGGDNGHMAVGEILSGLVNPSGKLVDEWNTDFTADPTWNNYGWNEQTGSQNMYYNGVYGTGVYEYKGNGDYDDHLTRAVEGETYDSVQFGGGVVKKEAQPVTYGTHNQNAYYGTDYEEDIYLGYNYWETLYESIYNGLLTNETVTYQGNGKTHTVTRKGISGEVAKAAAQAADEWWKKNVTFAFGYGLSYTTFSYNINAADITATGGALKASDEKVVKNFDITTDMTKANLESSNGAPAKVKTLFIPVTVTNTGSVAGKEAVQIYVTAPYNATSAKLQKSFVTLVGFGKTDIIKPGKSQTILVKVNVQDIASFDYANVYGDGTGYTLEEGEYKIRAMSSSHYDFATELSNDVDAYDEVSFTIANGTKARLQLDDFSGKLSTAIFSESYATAAKVNGNAWAKDTDDDHYQVFNSLRTENLMADGTSKEVLLTRDTILTYFPEAPTHGDLTFSTSYIDHMDYWNNFSAAETADDEWTHTRDELVVKEGWEQETGVINANGTYDILLSDMSGKKLFDDDGTLTDAWNAFMNQLTVEEMTTLIRKNGNMWRSTGLPNIGKAANQQKDSYNNNGDTLLWVDAPTITATWNVEIAYEIGRIRGNLSLYNGWSAWGGPEMDTHRSPFSGRNYEYLSQDGIVGGYIAAGLTGGMEAMGVTCYVKHFALNDQETCRDGMENMVWLSEQAARQNYFKVFQMAMQEGGSSSSMTGFARFCGVPTSSNNRLMQGMVVDQWGWDGFFITDGYSGFSRCTTMASMMKSYVVPLPLMGKIPAISGRYDKTEKKFYAYTGAWDTELEYKDKDGSDVLTTMYNDRGQEAGQAKGYYVGEEKENYTQWYYLRMLAARILYIESNALTNLNGHSLTTLLPLSEEDLTLKQGTEANVTFELSGEAKNTYTLDDKGNKTALYDTEYEIEGTLPKGLSFNASTGKISGTPTETGTFDITVNVTIDGWVNTTLVNDDRDSINPNLSKKYTIVVESGFYLEDANEKKIESLGVNVGDSFAAYIKSETIEASSYTLASGKLPEGLSLNAKEGTITGTVSEEAKNGTYTAVINVVKESKNQGGGGFPGGPGGWGGGGSSKTTYTYEVTFNVSGAEEVDEKYLTEAEIKKLIEESLSDVLTKEQIEEMVNASKGLTEEEVKALIEKASVGKSSGCNGTIATELPALIAVLGAASVAAFMAAKKRKENLDK